MMKQRRVLPTAEGAGGRHKCSEPTQIACTDKYLMPDIASYLVSCVASCSARTAKSNQGLLQSHSKSYDNPIALWMIPIESIPSYLGTNHVGILKWKQILHVSNVTLIWTSAGWIKLQIIKI